MSDFTADYESGLTVYALTFNGEGQAWNGAAFVDRSANWAACSVAMTDTGEDRYEGSLSPNLPSGSYLVQSYLQIGAGPAESDPLNGTRTVGPPAQGEPVVAINQILSQPQGTDHTYTFVLRDADGAVATGYLGTESLSCSIWSGQDQSVIATPSASWYDPAAGKINVTVAAADLDGIVPSLYRMSGKLVSGSTAILFFDGSLNVTPAPGAASAPSTYCSFNDVLLYAPQIQSLHDTEVDTAGMLGNRARARAWTNERILDGYRPNFGRARRAVSADGTTAGPHLRWVTAGPDGATTPTIEDLRGAITLGGLRVTDLVREANAHMAAATCYLNQPGRDNPYHQQGAYHQAKAADLLGQSVIEIDLDNPLDGVYDVRIGQDVTWLL